MLITEIKVQKRNKKRCSIYADGQYLMSVGAETAARFNLKAGDEITASFHKDILRQEEKRRIRERAERILAYRDRTPLELAKRVVRLGFDRVLVDEVIKDYVENRVLDEERLVQAFIADYSRLNLRGNLYIKRQLLAKGVAAGLVEKYLAERDEKEVAERLLDKLKARRKDLDRARAYRLLAGRGFTPAVVSEVIGEEF